MSEFSNKKNLLIIVGILVFAKFVALPVWEWQDSKVTKIQQLKDRLDKADSLSEQGSDFQKILSEAKDHNQNLLASINVTQDISSLKLKKMEELDKLLGIHDVKVTTSSWMAESGTDLTILNLKLGIRGKTKNVIKALLNIRQMTEVITLQDLSLRLVKMDDKTLGEAGGTIGISFYVLGPQLAQKYQVEAANASE
ncbi:hypothetical protein [Shewanella aestuarii]|uniref:Uncharacterized protein n=1 Tax=Shewanella aestuarii TaxID=1028752 RepID=A0A6G9QKZ5_9GAMM|nr:hypothetical protein [Shewanella aestuarii]QIR15142.1 hypothetical protein HBH39_12140 [Shewanella aestuarii]